MKKKRKKKKAANADWLLLGSSTAYQSVEGARVIE
jgi:hypothetical protein